jgi:hypothetical protein
VSKEPNTNASLPVTEYGRVQLLAEKAGWTVAGFSRMLLLWALPRWREAWKERTDEMDSADSKDRTAEST